MSEFEIYRWAYFQEGEGGGLDITVSEKYQDLRSYNQTNKQTNKQMGVLQYHSIYSQHSVSEYSGL